VSEAEKGLERNQTALYQDPPGLEQRMLEPFEPVTVRGYVAAGGRLAFEANAESEVAYAHQLNHCQQLLNSGILARVDVVRMGTTQLIGLMVEYDPEEKIKKKMAELMRG